MPSKRMAKANATVLQPNVFSQLRHGKTTRFHWQHDHLQPLVHFSVSLVFDHQWHHQVQCREFPNGSLPTGSIRRRFRCPTTTTTWIRCYGWHASPTTACRNSDDGYAGGGSTSTCWICSCPGQPMMFPSGYMPPPPMQPPR
jgi:hypothetical protein